MKLLLRREASWLFIVFFSAVFSEVSLQDTGGTITLRPDGTYSITVPEGNYVEMTITFSHDYGFQACYLDIFFEFHDGLNQSANVLSLFCEFYQKRYIFRSSGRHMWLKLHKSNTVRDGVFHASYTAKQLNFTVAPVLTQVKTTQVVLFNHSSYLWCPAEGAPAPTIVWRKNGIVVQNRTSVRYNMGIVKGNNNTYSCEVKNDDQLAKKELALFIEKCPDPCQCKYHEAAHSMLSVLCGGKQLKTVPRTLPFSTAVLDLSENQLKELPVESFSNNTEILKLLLSKNQLETLPPSVFGNNTKLELLDLSQNQLKVLPEGVFSNNAKLIYLLLFKNQLETLPPSVFGNNTKLEWL
ncbi:uncharacterized protein LOC144642133 [Oculina patagonica]